MKVKGSKSILCLKKNPHGEFCIITIENTLKAFQKEVDGPIETIPTGITSDTVFIMNEEGRIRGLDSNLRVGRNLIVGNVLMVKVKGDEFVSLSTRQANMLLYVMSHMLHEEKLQS